MQFSRKKCDSAIFLPNGGDGDDVDEEDDY